MANLRVQRCRGKERDAGASLVEFALIMPLLFLLLLGTLTGGLTLSRKNSLNNAVREATRFGAVSPVGTDVDAYLRGVLDRTRDGATGDLGALGSHVDNQATCAAVVYQTTASPPQIKTRRIREENNTRVASDALCYPDGRPATELRVQATAQRDSQIEALLFRQTVTLSSRSATRYER